MSEDVFGRSLEEDEPLPSPGAAQYYYERGAKKDASLFSYLTPQKPSSGKKGKKQRQRSGEGQLEGTMSAAVAQVEEMREEARMEERNEEEG